MTIKPQEKFMRKAISEALRAKKEGDYAVGAVLVKGDKIIAACSNRSRRDGSPIAHAEALAIIKGAQKLKKRHRSLIFSKSTEKIRVVKDFMRKECINLFHNDVI